MRDISIIGHRAVARRSSALRARVREVAAGRRARHRHAPQSRERRAVAAPRFKEYSAHPRRIRRDGRGSGAVRARSPGGDPLHRAHETRHDHLDGGHRSATGRAAGVRRRSTASRSRRATSRCHAGLVGRQRDFVAGPVEMLRALKSFFSGRPRCRAARARLDAPAPPHNARRSARAAAHARAKAHHALSADAEPKRDGQLRRRRAPRARGLSRRAEEVLQAIVAFVEGRTRAERRAAQRVIVAHVVARRARPMRRERTRATTSRIAERADGVACALQRRAFRRRAASDSRSACRAA